MLSQAQQIEKEERIKLVINTFLENQNLSINQLSQKLNIPSSTIQRDLNNVECIVSIYGIEAKEKLSIIRNRLKQNKYDGLSRGGINSTNKNEPIRDENGKFTGNRKK